jgi:hypothetical protein
VTAATDLHAQWRVALAAVYAATTDAELDRASATEVKTWDAWADAADDLGLCLECEGSSPDHAYCPTCRVTELDDTPRES